jgi:two-component system NarL family sensor kinase
MEHTYADMSLFLLIITVLLLFLLLLVLVLLFLHRKKQLKHSELLSAIHSLHDQQSLRLQLAVQEETFVYLARELHDNVNLSLTLVKLHLNGFRSRLNPGDQAELDNSLVSLENVSRQVSQLAKSWNTDVLESRGFLSALQAEVERIGLLGAFYIEFCTLGEPVHLDNKKEIVVLRLIQEAFNNILKHANARNVRLQLTYSHCRLEISIDDDGKGFSMNDLAGEAYRTGGKSGLRNLQSRIKLIGGTMQLESFPGSGTKLLFTIPVPPDQQFQ